MLKDKIFSNFDQETSQNIFYLKRLIINKSLHGLLKAFSFSFFTAYV